MDVGGVQDQVGVGQDLLALDDHAGPEDLDMSLQETGCGNAAYRRVRR